MAMDVKYGRVTLEIPHSVGDDEPVVVFRAQDSMFIEILDIYRTFCQAEGCTPEHIALVEQAMMIGLAWQKTHETKIPD